MNMGFETAFMSRLLLALSLHLMCILFLHMNVFTTCYFHSLDSRRRFWVHSSLSGYFHKFICLYYFGKWSQGIAVGHTYVMQCRVLFKSVFQLKMYQNDVFYLDLFFYF